MCQPKRREVGTLSCLQKMYIRLGESNLKRQLLKFCPFPYISLNGYKVHNLIKTLGKASRRIEPLSNFINAGGYM